MDKNFKKIVVLAFLLLGVLTFGLTVGTSVVNAYDIETGPREISQRDNLLIKWGDQLNLEDLMKGRVSTAINFFVLFSVLIAVALIVASGYMFITSAGDAEKIQKAQKALTAAIVGMVIVFLARLIVGFFIDFGAGGSTEGCTPGECIPIGGGQYSLCVGGTWETVPACPN